MNGPAKPAWHILEAKEEEDGGGREKEKYETKSEHSVRRMGGEEKERKYAEKSDTSVSNSVKLNFLLHCSLLCSHFSLKTLLTGDLKTHSKSCLRSKGSF